jgi:flagellar biosynthesis/type III secretory pathway chaperone
MNANELSEIHNMMQQDLATSRQLLALLEKESDSTQARDYASMSQLLKDKKPLLEQLKINAQQRSSWLSSLNCTPNEKNWNKLLQSLNSEDIQKQWNSVRNNTVKKSIM